MTNPILQLVNPEECPKSTHPDKHLFKPMSEASKNRQAVYSFISKKPGHTFALNEIVLGTKLQGKDVYAAAHHLCRKNLATRSMVDMILKTKKGEKPIQRIGISFIEPWSTKINRKW
jgi:hypothetical protein